MYQKEVDINSMTLKYGRNFEGKSVWKVDLDKLTLILKLDDLKMIKIFEMDLNFRNPQN